MEKNTAIVRAHAIHIPKKPRKKWKLSEDEQARLDAKRTKAKHTNPMDGKARSFADTPLSEIENDKILAREILRREYDNIPPLTLTIDCETEVVDGQALRYGFAIVHGMKSKDIVAAYREGTLTQELLNQPKETYCFHSFAEEGSKEVNLLADYCKEKQVLLCSRNQFIGLFYRWAFDFRALVIGHNLVFDLTRLAIDWSESRDEFEGGFTLTLCDCHTRLNDIKRGACWFHPSLRIKKLGPGKWFYGFTKVPFDPDNYIEGERSGGYDGTFLDTNTFCKSVLGKSGSLKRLCKELRMPAHRTKLDSPVFGGPLTRREIEYAHRDPEATRAVFEATLKFFSEHGLFLPLHLVYSEASIGKAHLKKLGVTTLKERFALQGRDELNEDGHIPAGPRLLGFASEAFYGGRAEVGFRCTPIECITVDFKAQYPTIQVLMGLQEILLAKKLYYRSCKLECDELLRGLNPSDIAMKPFWKRLRVFVRVTPNGDIFPLRTNDGIATPIMTSEHALWYALADVCASLVLTHKIPEIIDAVELVPEGVIPNNIEGEFFLTLTNKREALNRLKKAAEKRGDVKEEREYDGKQWALKLAGCGTVFGIFNQINVEGEYSEEAEITCWTGDGNSHTFLARNREGLGQYYYPPISSLITAGGRLLLALVEHWAVDEGLLMVYCDTDGFAFGKPDGMKRAEFETKVSKIVSQFSGLSLYDDGKGGLIDALQIEKGMDAPLYAYAVSPKRYSLFRVLPNGEPDIVKFTEHGLGGFVPPNKVRMTASRFRDKTAEQISEACEKLGGHPWIYEAWYLWLRFIIGTSEKLCVKGARKYPIPMDDEFPVNARSQVTLSTAKRMRLYSIMKGARPCNFFSIYQVPHKEEGKSWALESFYTEYNCDSDGDEIETGNILARRTHGEDRDLYEVQPRTLGEVLFPPAHLSVSECTHFTHENKKAANGEDFGLQHRKRVHIEDIQYMSKEVHSLSDGEDELPEKDAEAAGEAINVYVKAMGFAGSVFTAFDCRDRSLQRSIAGPLNALRKAGVSVKELVEALDTSEQDIHAMCIELSREPLMLVKPNAGSKREVIGHDCGMWVSPRMLARFQAVREELFERAGISLDAMHVPKTLLTERYPHTMKWIEDGCVGMCPVEVPQIDASKEKHAAAQRLRMARNG